MANNRIRKYIGAIALGAVLVAVPSCTDTWDDHYTSDSASGATGTLWDKIKDNHSYSRFADIVRNAKYYKDDTHPVPTYTYEDILSGGQVNTIWVPDNDALTEEEYQKWMTMLGESRADEGGNSNAAYNVQQQFLGNHIALWRHNISEPGIDTVKMINGKNLIFDKTARTLEGVPLGDEYNIPTANGVMHVLKGIAPFHYNFYEYLKFSEPQTTFGKYVASKDTTYFDTSRSVEGLPDENGNPTYVDSVYYTSNRLFYPYSYLPDEGREKWEMAQKGFGRGGRNENRAELNNEDSVYIVLLPTDAAWDATYAKLQNAYIYPSTYDDKSKGDLNATASRKIADVDSLQKMSIEMDMIAPLVFNLKKQPKKGPKKGTEIWTTKMFKGDKSDFDDIENRDKFLLNTNSDTLRAIGSWKPSSLFDGEMVEMSNGLGYIVNSLNFPSQYYTPDVEVEVENTGIFYNMESSKYKVGPESRRYTFSNEAYREITEKYGIVSNNNFYHFSAPGPTAGPKVEIKIYGNDNNAYVPDAQVMSGKYDIQVVMVPHWYIDIAIDAEIGDKFYRTDTIVSEVDITDTTFVRRIDEWAVDSIAGSNKYKFKATLSYNNNTAKDKTQASKAIEYNGLKVDTLTVFEDFEFPYSYKNLRFSYPTLYLEGSTSKTDNKNGFVYDFVIDKIILRRKN